MRTRLSAGLLLGAAVVVLRVGFEPAGAAGPQAPPRPAVPQAAAVPRAVAASPAADHAATLKRYCVGCHNEQQKARGVVPSAFDGLGLADVGAHAQQWESVVRKMRAGMMPPAGMPRPDEQTRDALV